MTFSGVSVFLVYCVEKGQTGVTQLCYLSIFLPPTSIHMFVYYTFFLHDVSLSGRRAWPDQPTPSTPSTKRVPHKTNTNPRTMAAAAATKIKYSESDQWSDTSISSPAGDSEKRCGHYKGLIVGRKSGQFFYPSAEPPPPFHRQYHFLQRPAGGPTSTTTLKMEALLLSINIFGRLHLCI